MENLKAIVVGRHAPDFGNLTVEVVELINVTFPATGKETEPILLDLAKKAAGAGAVLLFQNVPAPLAAALISVISYQGLAKEWVSNPAEGFTSESMAQYLKSLPAMGVVVSVPSAMPTEPEKGYFSFGWDEAIRFESAIKFANPQAKIVKTGEVKYESVTFTITSQPPRPFVFDHIEWLYEAS